MRLFAPGKYVRSVDRIDLEALWATGKRFLLFDRDNTLVPRDTGSVPAAARRWVERAEHLGFKCIVVSNNWHRDQVRASAEELGMGAIPMAMKPAPFALRAGLRRLGADPSRAVMIGDQVYTDVAAGNLAGIDTILVQPQCSSDLWYTQLFRVFERRSLRHVDLED